MSDASPGSLPAPVPADCWPTQDQQLLLRAALGSGDEARSAWRSWQSRNDFEAVDGGSYRLFPLVYRNLVNQGVELDVALTRFKGVYRLTWSHNNFLFRHTSKIVQTLMENSVPVMLLKGAPLALVYYGEVGLRPMSDLDIMVHPQHRDRAIDILLAAGYQPLEQLKQRRLNITHSFDFKDADGFTIDLHWYLMQEACDPARQEGWWQRAQTMDFCGVAVSRLDDTDHLFHTIAHGCRWNPFPPFRWIADAAVTIDSANIDWPRLVGLARQFRLTVTLRESLLFMAQVLPGRIPGQCLLELASATVNRAEAKEFHAKANEFTVLRRITFHWNNYQRVSEFMPAASRPGFLAYLLQRWELDHPLQLAGVVRDKLQGERQRRQGTQ